MGIRLWVKEQVAKLRRKNDNDESESGDNNAKHRQLQAVDGQGGGGRTRGCSVLFARAKKHHEDRSDARKKTRSRSHPAHVSQSRSEDSRSDARKVCVSCQTMFSVTASKYLDYCSTECKTKASMDKGQPAEAPTRASEWI